MDKGVSILIVEDDPDLMLTTALFLKEEGYRAGFAGNGREALDWIKESGDPDVILLDLHMPIMNGVEFMSEYVGTAAIVITTSFPEGAKFADGTAISVCEKPYQFGTLSEHIEHAIEANGGPKWKRLLPCRHTCFTMDIEDDLIIFQCLIPGCEQRNAVHTEQLDFKLSLIHI